MYTCERERISNEDNEPFKATALNRQRNRNYDVIRFIMTIETLRNLHFGIYFTTIRVRVICKSQVIDNSFKIIALGAEREEVTIKFTGSLCEKYYDFLTVGNAYQIQNFVVSRPYRGSRQPHIIIAQDNTSILYVPEINSDIPLFPLNILTKITKIDISTEDVIVNIALQVLKIYPSKRCLITKKVGDIEKKIYEPVKKIVLTDSKGVMIMLSLRNAMIPEFTFQQGEAVVFYSVKCKKNQKTDTLYLVSMVDTGFERLSS